MGIRLLTMLERTELAFTCKRIVLDMPRGAQPTHRTPKMTSFILQTPLDLLSGTALQIARFARSLCTFVGTPKV